MANHFCPTPRTVALEKAAERIQAEASMHNILTSTIGRSPQCYASLSKAQRRTLKSKPMEAHFMTNMIQCMLHILM
jgi:hypothetical protein